jgi:hypothetical protein
MINEYPIDVNFYIAVRPPVPAVIYSCSIELGVAITEQLNPTSFIFFQLSLWRFQTQAGVAAVMSSSTC